LAIVFSFLVGLEFELRASPLQTFVLLEPHLQQLFGETPLGGFFDIFVP
jgi:hypothetical protein